MKPILLLLLIALAGCGSIRSTIGIEAGEQFVLGGEQRGAFRAELLNVGPVPVGVAEVTAEGDTLAVAELAPGASATARFAAGSAALLINRGDREAAVRGTVRGDTNLGMRYAPAGNREAPAP